jgi:hypothetical protein
MATTVGRFEFVSLERFATAGEQASYVSKPTLSRSPPSEGFAHLIVQISLSESA